MEEFGEAKQEWFKSFLELPNGIPSHDTFNRVFALLEPKEFQRAFSEWTATLRKALSQEIVAIDGKTLRRSGARERSPIHMVSAWATENRLVLGQVAVEEKSNEITAIPELLKNLQLKGCIVTIDAMGCQKDIAQAISEAGADYCLALKANHQTLHGEVESFMEDAQSCGFKGIKHGGFQSEEEGHGREETRRYWITSDIDWLHRASEWMNLHSIGMVESTRKIGEKVSTERRFYLSSLPADPKRFAQAVRGHWGIENSLHWVLDVSFNEDQCRVREGNAAENLAILRHLALNLLRQDTQKKRGIKTKQKCAGWDHKYLLSLLGF
jgi:predicted transposase YbfD/YdcC